MEQYERAIVPLRRAVELSHRGSWPVAKLGRALAHVGREAEAHALLGELEGRAASEPTVSAAAIATLHLHLGNQLGFCAWLHRGIDDRDPFALSINREFLWKSVRGEPEFRRLAERIGLTNV